MTDDGKDKKVNIDFQPFKPINTSLYLCDNKFHTEVRAPPSPHTLRSPPPHAAPPVLARSNALLCVAPARGPSPASRGVRRQALNELLEDDEKFGFVIMDGNGCLFGTLCGNTRTVLHKFSVDLPKKHGRGGQSAARFARLRLEKRKNYVRKVRGVVRVATPLSCSHKQPASVAGRPRYPPSPLYRRLS